jgi:hypothetical protein
MIVMRVGHFSIPPITLSSTRHNIACGAFQYVDIGNLISATSFRSRNLTPCLPVDDPETSMAEQAQARPELEEDRPFQERFWNAQRVAWFILILIVIAALAGFSGQGGPFARATVSGPAGMIDYPRVTRWETSDEIRLTLGAGIERQAVVEIGPAFPDLFELEDIQPAPAESHAGPNGQRLVFHLDPAPARREVIMHVRAMRPSFTKGIDMRIGEGPRLRIRSVVLP